MFFILILAFFETPSSLSISSDISMSPSYLTKYEFPCGVLETIDLFCLLLFFADACIKSYLIGSRRVAKSPWLMAYYFVLFVSICDVIASMAFKCDEVILDSLLFNPSICFLLFHILYMIQVFVFLLRYFLAMSPMGRSSLPHIKVIIFCIYKQRQINSYGAN